MMIQEKFIERLKKAMAANEINARELSKRCGLSEGGISRYLSGKMEPRVPAIAKMAEALRVDPVWLMGYDELETRTDAFRVDVVNSITDGLNEKSLERLKSYADYLRSMQEDNET
jgi:transcriptional regulator with XRE-family HTH domain